MRILACTAGMGHKEFFLALQLEGRKFLCIGATTEHDDIGKIIELSLHEIRDASVPMSLEEIKNYVDPSLYAYLVYQEEDKAKKQADAELNDVFYVMERTSTVQTHVIENKLREWGLKHFYSTGGYLRVRCKTAMTHHHVQTFVEMGVPAGYNVTNIVKPANYAG